MADGDITISITKSNIVLATAGKYCPANIDLTIAGPIYDTSDATAVAANIIPGKTAYVNGGKVEGSCPIYNGKFAVTPQKVLWEGQEVNSISFEGQPVETVKYIY